MSLSTVRYLLLVVSVALIILCIYLSAGTGWTTGLICTVIGQVLVAGLVFYDIWRAEGW